MSLLSSMDISNSSLNAGQKSLEKIGQNISNVGTIGHKKDEVSFETVMQESAMGTDTTSSKEAGVKLGHKSKNMSQGDLSISQNPSDMAIRGKGFFIFDKDGQRQFTRNGSFQFDKEGFLVNKDGLKVQGYEVDQNGKATGALSPVKIKKPKLPPVATSNVKLSVNLDARAANKVFDATKKSDTSNFSTTMTVIDSSGKERLLNVYFNRVDKNNWEYRVYVDKDDAVNPEQITESAQGTLSFDEEGKLLAQNQSVNSFEFKDGPGASQINFDFASLDAEKNSPTTLYGTTSQVTFQDRNGYKEGEYQNFIFGDGGTLSVEYSNGQRKDIYQVALAGFVNEDGLQRAGEGYFKSTKSSGQENIGKSGDDGLGEVLTGNLELSNVDITAEYLNMMQSQQAFNAASKSFNVSDKLLQDTINLIR